VANGEDAAVRAMLRARHQTVRQFLAERYQVFTGPREYWRDPRFTADEADTRDTGKLAGGQGLLGRCRATLLRAAGDQQEIMRLARKIVLDVAYQGHPGRFVRRPPKPLPLPSEVWINKPAKN
jgi:hypothetical protein